MRSVLYALLVAVAAVPCIVARELPAQRQLDASAGATDQRVRVTMTGGDRMIGQLVEVGADSVTLLLATRGERRVIARSSIDGIAISMGKRGNALKGLAFGAGGGLLVGALVGAAAEASCDASDYCGIGTGAAAGVAGIAGGVAGGLLGTVVGALVRTEKWADDMVLPSPRVSLKVMKKGIGIRILTR